MLLSARFLTILYEKMEKVCRNIAEITCMKIPQEAYKFSGGMSVF